MYYQLQNGHLMTQHDMHIAYEILTGEPVDTDSKESVQKYDAWLKSNTNIKRVIYDTTTLSIEDLAINGHVLEAAIRYRKEHDCSIKEARDAVELMRHKPRKEN